MVNGLVKPAFAPTAGVENFREEGIRLFAEFINKLFLRNE